MISYELRDASCELWVAILRKLGYELLFTSCNFKRINLRVA